MKKLALSCYSTQRWTADGDLRRRQLRYGRHLKREHSNHPQLYSHKQVTTLCAEYMYAANDRLGKWVSMQQYAALSASCSYEFNAPRPGPTYAPHTQRV